MTKVEKLRKFLMNWVFAPSWIRIVCFVLSKVVRGKSTIDKYKKNASRLCVMGNGPSLKKDLEKYGDEIMSYDRLAVNFMGTTPEYLRLKPTCYVLADPVFFINPDELPLSSREKVAALQNVLINKTSWPMTLVTLGDRADTPLIKALKSNANISVLSTFIGVPVPPDIRDFCGWIHNRYSPPAQNVVNMAIYLSIVWRYSEVYLLGADTSFHQMVHVDQATNMLYEDDEHYYGVERRYIYADPGQKTPQRLDRFLYEISTVFSWYCKLREFADWAGVRIVNASSYSLIDAFERPHN